MCHKTRNGICPQNNQSIKLVKNPKKVNDIGKKSTSIYNQESNKSNLQKVIETRMKILWKKQIKNGPSLLPYNMIMSILTIDQVNMISNHATLYYSFEYIVLDVQMIFWALQIFNCILNNVALPLYNYNFQQRWSKKKIKKPEIRKCEFGFGCDL